VKRFHGLLDRHGRIAAVDLIEIDEVGAETLQAVVDLGKDRLARQAGAVSGPGRIRPLTLVARCGASDGRRRRCCWSSRKVRRRRLEQRAHAGHAHFARRVNLSQATSLAPSGKSVASILPIPRH
jgi:hypothetical protein